ncbi:MAG TPA: amino acid adenylation domain-containing protein [Firmicutes bacterium]|nr:amino acid adenylation domain-containing protein [Bacillota bacterium]
MRINILAYLEQSAARCPHKDALIDEKESITFSDLERFAKALGSSILAAGPGVVRRPVVVLADRTAATVVSLLGVVYSGNFYVPIDNRMPQERLQLMLAQMQPAMIICTEKDLQRLEGMPGLPPCLVYEHGIRAAVDAEALAKIRELIIDTDPVYMIYTSGSTGTPKGIVVSHRSMIDLAEWLDDTFAFSSDEILGNQTPFYFDASVKDVCLCLKKGITMVIIPTKLFMFPLLLVDCLNTHRVTTILWATSALVLIANSGVFAHKAPLYLRKVFFAGEAMLARHLNIWRTYLPEALYVNLYGPTEVTVDCTYYVVDREFADDEPVPIGRACRNMEVFLLDGQNRLVTGEEPGEICVRGTGVALGYYREPERTAEVFVQNPLHNHYRDLIYRTGDIARYNAYGELVFCCRKDQQIKHQGHRIELGEIEQAAGGVTGVTACVCFYDREKEKIVLQYTGTADSRELRKNMARKLPKYMLPHVITRRESFPYNANGKIDRKKITELYYEENH